MNILLPLSSFTYGHTYFFYLCFHTKMTSANIILYFHTILDIILCNYGTSITLRLLNMLFNIA